VTNPDLLVGAWSLEQFAIHIEGRPPIFPFGADAIGSLVYARSGAMSAVLSKKARPPLGVSRLENASRADPVLRAAAFDSYLSYAGRWRLEGDTMVHTVTMASAPDNIGQDNVRSVSLDGDVLTLSYEIAPPSKNTRHYTLIWRRDA
jgi:hypothetical protein